MSKVAKTVRRVPVLIIGITILVTLFFGYALRNLEIEADLVKAIPSDLPEVQFFDQVNEEFPRQEFAIVGLIADDVFTAQTIAKLDLLTTEFEQVRGVGQVIGPTNVNLIRGTDEGVEISPILDGMPETPAEIDAFRATITTNPLYRNTFVSEDETAALILVQIDDGDDRDRILADIEDIVATHRTDGEAYRIAGETATLAAVRSLITSDLVLLSPLVVVVILLVLYLSFRTARGVILPVLTVVIGTVWTLGIMSLLRVPLSILTTVTPTILIAVGSAYGIHIINRFEIEIDGSASGEDPIGRTLRDTGLAVLMAGLTTVAGFLSFLSSRIEVIREFGLFAALGVACTLVFSLTFVPALLALMPASRVRRQPRHDDRPARLERTLSRVGAFTSARGPLVLLIALLVLAASIVGIARIQVESDLVQMFGKNTQIMRDNEFFNNSFAGTLTLQIVVDGRRPDAMKDPDMLLRVEQIQAYADEFELVGSSQSVVDIIKEMNRVMNAEDEAFNTIPESRNLVSQYLLLYSLTGEDDTLENLVNFDYSKANVTVFVKTGNFSALRAFEDRINEFVHENIDPSDAEVSITGRISTLTVLGDLIVRSQLLSMAISLVVVLVITTVIFSSALFGTIATVPIVATIAINFGLMGWFGIPLDLATVLIASVAVGIGIDYSIHYLAHYRTARMSGIAPSAAVTHTSSMTGRAIVFNALAVGAGFLVLVFSSLASVGVLGAMIALTMAISSFGALTLLPALLAVLERRPGLATALYGNSWNQEGQERPTGGQE